MGLCGLCQSVVGSEKQEDSYSHLPAYEDGTDRVFRNVGI